MDYDMRSTIKPTITTDYTGLNLPMPDTPDEMPPIPDKYKIEALDLVEKLQRREDTIVGYIDRIARWLMERDKKWQSR